MVRAGFRSLIAFILLCGPMIACDTGSGDAAGTGVIINPPMSSDKVVCTPFSSGDSSLPYNGLISNLYYLTDDQPRYSTASDMITNGHKADVTLFLNRLETPTRPFDQGFVTEAGNVITMPNGTTLYEYFALHAESFLKLREGDPEGNYQLAILADDGAVVKINDGSGFRTLINNDNTHPTKMGCAYEAIPMTKDSMIPIQVDYFQGPRYHIALTMVWRPVAGDQSSMTDPYCGLNGNSFFWDSTTTPSTPTGYNNLLARGWRPLNTENFRLPSSMGSNPCAQNTEITITNFRILNVTQTSATFQWDTNVPSSSIVTTTPSGGLSSDTVDPTPVVSHSVVVPTLLANTFYEVYVSSTAGSASISNTPSTFRTLR